MIKRILISSVVGLALTSIVSARVPLVVADIPPTYSLVAQVMKGVGQPHLIVRVGASPHAYMMRPSDAAAIESADLVFLISYKLTPWLCAALKTLGKNAQVLELMDVNGSTVLPYREADTFKPHSHDGGQQQLDGNKTDPHGWLDPENGKAWIDVIATELSKLDPENARTYFENADHGKVNIDTVASEIEAILKPFLGVNFIVSHDAYQYFEKHFSISAAGSISSSDASNPSPSRLEQIRKTVEILSVRCVFSEPQFNPGLISSVIDGTQATAWVIDPLGTKFPPSHDFYLNLLRNLGQSLASCL